jgi:hypothetical protein
MTITIKTIYNGSYNMKHQLTNTVVLILTIIGQKIVDRVWKCQNRKSLIWISKCQNRKSLNGVSKCQNRKSLNGLSKCQNRKSLIWISKCQNRKSLIWISNCQNKTILILKNISVLIMFLFINLLSPPRLFYNNGQT